MSAKRQHESFDVSAGKMAAAIIVGVYALQIGLAAVHLYFSDHNAARTALPSALRDAAPLSDVQACASADVDIALCEVAVTRVLDAVRAAHKYCPPPGDSRSPASILRRYLVEHPAATAVPLDAALATALAAAWPCRDAGPGPFR